MSAHQQTMDSTKYPVVSEIWSMLEATLLTQAKRLTEDIAKSHNKNPKELWSQIKGQINIGLFEVDIEPKLCSHALNNREGAVRLRCRDPCALGFDACPLHIHSVQKEESKYEKVSCIKDCSGQTYYLNSKHIAMDKNGKPKGVVENNILYLFERG